MDPGRRREPAPVEIELIAVDAADDRSGGGASRPPPAGAGTLPALSQVLGTVAGTVVTRIATVPDPPLVPSFADRPVWSDQRVHRLVRLAPWDAAPALDEVLGATGGRIRAPSPPRRRRRLPLGAAVLDLGAPPSEAVEDGIRLGGTLAARRWGRATPVVLTVVPWSVHQTGLSLQPLRGRLGTHLPRRYYDVAHLVMDELWHLIERAAAA